MSNRKSNQLSLVGYYHAGGAFPPICTSDGIDTCTAQGFGHTLISIAEVRQRCLEIKPCEWTRNSSCSALQTSISDESAVATERSHDLKCDKGTI